MPESRRALPIEFVAGMVTWLLIRGGLAVFEDWRPGGTIRFRIPETNQHISLTIELEDA